MRLRTARNAFFRQTTPESRKMLTSGFVSSSLTFPPLHTRMYMSSRLAGSASLLRILSRTKIRLSSRSRASEARNNDSHSRSTRQGIGLALDAERGVQRHRSSLGFQLPTQGRGNGEARGKRRRYIFRERGEILRRDKERACRRRGFQAHLDTQEAIQLLVLARGVYRAARLHIERDKRGMTLFLERVGSHRLRIGWLQTRTGIPPATALHGSFTSQHAFDNENWLHLRLPSDKSTVWQLAAAPEHDPHHWTAEFHTKSHAVFVRIEEGGDLTLLRVLSE